MRVEQGRGSPGHRGDKKGKGPRSLTPDATPRQDVRGPRDLTSVYGNTPNTGLPTGEGSEIPQSEEKVIVTYQVPAGNYFGGGTLTLVGSPDDDARRWRAISEIHGGGWNKPLDAGAAAGVPAPKRTPSLDGGAAAEIEPAEMVA